MECWTKRTVLEKKSLVLLIVVLTLMIGLITIIVLVTERHYCYTSACSEAFEHIHKLMNASAKPCDNFYNFVCANHSNYTHQHRNSANILREIIMEPIDNKDTPTLQLQKVFFRSCTDLEAIDADNDRTFTRIIENLGGWPVVSGNNWNESAFDFAEFMVELRDRGLQHDWFLDIAVFSNWGQNIILEINLPDNANKVEKETEAAYMDLMVKTAVAFGAHEDLARSQVPDVMYFENKLANLIDQIHTKNEQKTLPLITIAEVQEKWQNLNWLEIINHITKKNLSDDQHIVFHVEKYMPELDKLLKHTTRRTQVNYVIWKLVEAYSPFLSKKIRTLMHNYALTTNKSQLWYNDRTDFCFEEAKAYFQYSLEATYLRRHVTKSQRKNIEGIIERVLEQVERHLRQAKWLDKDLKRLAINKLENVSSIIGGPEEMYYAQQFDQDFGVGDIVFNSSNIIYVVVDMFNKSIDTLFHKNYENVNYLKYTFYELVTSEEIVFYQNYNLIWIPAGALHGFFYDDKRPNYLNYATLGTTIAYKLIRSIYASLLHNLHLWSNNTLINFNRTVGCIKNCSKSLSEHEKTKCDYGLIESLSDYIGINLSYEAYRRWAKQHGPEVKLVGAHFRNYQLFWMAYGTSMCQASDPELASDQALRINGAFRNSPHFNRDFRCALGSSMNPPHKCQIL